MSKYLDKLENVAMNDVANLFKAEKSYGDSWMKRGGVGAFMMLCRKWDRIEKQLQSAEAQYDIFNSIVEDGRPEGLIDDIRDLRRYLLLVEAHLIAEGTVTIDEAEVEMSPGVEKSTAMGFPLAYTCVHQWNESTFEPNLVCTLCDVIWVPCSVHAPRRGIPTTHYINHRYITPKIKKNIT